MTGCPNIDLGNLDIILEQLDLSDVALERNTERVNADHDVLIDTEWDTPFQNLERISVHIDVHFVLVEIDVVKYL